MIKPLNCEAEDMSSEWQLWKDQLVMWMDIMGVEAASKKLSYLRLLGGVNLQKICINLQVGDGEENFENLIIKLDGFFIQQKSLRFERYVFRQIVQKEGEKFDTFLLRLRKQALKCGWTLWISNENIADQIVAGCQSDKLRTRIMEKDTDLEDIIAKARSIESVELQKKLFHPTDHKTPAESVSNVMEKKGWENENKLNMTCYQCGRKGHIASSNDCPARGRTCNSCGKLGHFAIKCLSKKDGKGVKRQNEDNKNQFAKKLKGGKSWGRVNEVKGEDKESDDEEEILGLFHLGAMDKIKCAIGEIPIEMIIDSGAAVNVIGEADWIELERKGVKMLAKTSEPKKKLTGKGK